MCALRSVIVLVTLLLAIAMGKLQVEKLVDCGKPNGPAKFRVTTKGFDKNNEQLVDVAINITKYDIGDQTRATLKIFVPAPTNRNKWFKVFDINDERGVCDLLNKYMYKVWFQLQKDVGMVPEQCPIKMGSYSATNYRIQFEKLNLPVIPPGLLKIEAKGFLKATNEQMACLLVLLKNN